MSQQGEHEQIGHDDELGIVHAAAVLVAESERLRAALAATETELVVTRQLLRVMQEDRHRVFGVVNETVQLVRAMAEDIGASREIVERMDGLVGDLTEKVKNVQLPSWIKKALQQ